MNDSRTIDRARAGSALLLVLWSIGVLSVVVTSMIFDAHIEARIAIWRRNRTKAQYLARSGMEIAELMLMRSEEIKQGSEEAEEGRWAEPARQLAEGLPVRNFRHELGDGTVTVEIVPEPARRNINKLTSEEDWERLLEAAGIPEFSDLGLILADSFLDWFDRDDIPRMYGAETDDFYGRLAAPYRAKNGPLDTVEELLLIRGFTRPILFGGVLNPDDPPEEAVQMPGIADMLTVYGDGKVNVNAATRRVLMTLPGVDEFIAEAILAEREGWTDEQGQRVDASFENINDFFGRVPEVDRVALQPLVVTRSTIFRITVGGEVQGVVSRAWCIAQYANRRLTLLRWREDH